jgi:8-oxo-dGTP diphosphatase
VTSIPAFGDRVEGQAYVLRPGGLAILTDVRGRLATVKVGSAWFLPGGGQDEGELPEAAAIREAVEECGLRIELLDVIGVADEFLYAASEHTHFQKRGTFFLARVLGPAPGPTEPDHELVWLAPDEALTCLSHGSHRWAVREALRRGASPGRAGPR